MFPYNQGLHEQVIGCPEAPSANLEEAIQLYSNRLEIPRYVLGAATRAEPGCGCDIAEDNSCLP